MQITIIWKVCIDSKTVFNKFFVLFLPLSLILSLVGYAQQRPNILVILSDDGGYEDFGCFGGTDVYTPHIDSLAAAGVRFTNAYTTASVCAPSRAGLLTGRYQQRFGFEHNVSNLPAPGVRQEDVGMDTSVRTIGDHLQAAGYKTIAIGKWHQGDEAKHFPLKRGFDHFYGFVGGHRSYFSIRQGAVPRQEVLHDDNEVVAEEEITYLTENFTDKAVHYIHRYKDQPFFMFLSFNAVHTPMEAKSDTYAKYAHVQDTLRRTYLAMLEDMDSGIGRVVEQLKADGLYENTVIIFLNDNGAATNNGSNNGKWRGLKGSKWEGGIRVPFVMQWPGVLPANSTSNTMVSAMDILPTALAIAGGNVLPGQTIDGKNLLDSYNMPEAGHDILFWRRGIGKAVRYQNWKLIQAGDNPILLFDLDKDSREEHNIADQHPERVKTLLQRLQSWEDTVEAPRWYSAYGDENQLLKHRMEVQGRDMEKMYP